MPKAEFGSTKYLSNKLRAKGLQRLRWYCQVCEKQCLDANGFSLHSKSESHVRKMLVIGEDPKKYINDFSNQFLKDFLQLLKTGHGEKPILINRFYQEYIANKEHVHMNATKWPSLTEFAKHLGREGICRVQEDDDGIHIAWINNSPEALRRQDALRRKEAQDQGDEQAEQRIIREQIRRAQEHAGDRENGGVGDSEDRGLNRQDGEKVKLSFGSTPKLTGPAPKSTEGAPPGGSSSKETEDAAESEKPIEADGADKPLEVSEAEKGGPKPGGLRGLSIKMGGKPQPKNVFAQAKKNALSGSKKASKVEQPKKMSEAERIMKEEIERKRSRGSAGFGMPPGKKQRSH